MRQMHRIRTWISPLKPDSRCYSAILSYPHAQGCVRIKKWGDEWRIVLRVLDKRDKSFVDLRFVEPDKKIHYLQVFFINLRDASTYTTELPDRMLALV